MAGKSMRVAAVLGVTVIALAGASDAIAKKHHKKPKTLGPVVVATATSAIPPGPQTAPASAACPAGTNIVGGGFSTTPKTGVGAITIESHASGNGWTATALNTSPSAGSVTVEAYCRKNAPALTEVPSTAIVPGATASPPVSGTGTATATCPAGTHAVAGGFKAAVSVTPVLHGALPISSRRTADAQGWTAAASTGSATPSSVTSYAYCAKESVMELASPAASVTGTNTAQDVVASPCPAVKVKKKAVKHGRKRVKKVKRPTTPVAGGFVGPPPTIVPPSDTDTVLAFASLRAAPGWTTTAVQLGNATGTFTTYAYCAL